MCIERIKISLKKVWFLPSGLYCYAFALLLWPAMEPVSVTSRSGPVLSMPLKIILFAWQLLSIGTIIFVLLSNNLIIHEYFSSIFFFLGPQRIKIFIQRNPLSNGIKMIYLNGLNIIKFFLNYKIYVTLKMVMNYWIMQTFF